MALLGGIYAPNTPTLIGDLGIRHEATEQALKDLGQRIQGLSPIDAVVVISPHFVTGTGFGLVNSSPLRQIFDFAGFPSSFYQVHYTPPGAADVVQALEQLSRQAQIPIAITDQWGLDHGAWAPLYHLFPAANIPVVPISICPELGPVAHEALGQQIHQLAKKFHLLVLATGSLIHRLDLWNQDMSSYPDDARQYLRVAKEAFGLGQWEILWNAPEVWREQAAPEGGELPLRVLAGAIPSYCAEILAEEEEFSAVSLTTVFFEPTGDKDACDERGFRTKSISEDF
ncbi:dioxygenase family protein [Sulfobacillus thermosulfidooxidans]|uniref:dioxygenase family protein n=1 Tax=Sulfobacillus thermosulfidooxidans TaxID=28034 RepID=UPI0006B59325|nr:dioxygenase [Sulfobacillus thermosulfidooxidans]